MSPRSVAGAPTLGVLVPTLDEEEHLPALLARLLDASEPDDRADELVIADGGSQDQTPRLARARARLVESARGRGRQLAEGAAQLGTDVLLVNHADCVPAPGALARVRAAFASPAVAATAMRQRIDAQGAAFRVIERAANLRSRLGLVYGDSGLALRRSLYEELGGFRSLPLFEDVDLALRLGRRTRVRWLSDAVLLVSPRRWMREGLVRCTLRNWALSAAFLCGGDPERLARRYPPHSRP